MRSTPGAELEQLRRVQAVGIAGVVTGTLLAVVGTFWLAFGGGELGHASLTRADLASRTLAPSVNWIAFTMILATALALLAGPRPAGRVSLASIAGAVWTLFWVWTFSVLGSGWELSGPHVTCVREGCWPQGWQELAVAAPLVVGSFALLVLGLVGGQTPAWVRRGLPPVLFLVLAIVQVALWESDVVPILLGPSPVS